MVLQQARLNIGRQFQARVVECLAHDFGLRHFVVVPVKDIALAINRGIARRELERITGNSLFGTQANKVHQLVLRIRRIGVMHGGTAVAQTPLRPEQGFSGQADKRFGDIQCPRADKQVIIDIARFGLPAAVGGVVIIDFIT